MATPTADKTTLNGLLGKLDDADPDLRYMSLNDILALLNNKNSTWLSGDNTTAGKAVDGILKALQDQNGEVQNMALKCQGPLVKRLGLDVLTPFIDNLAKLCISKNVDTAVPCSALREVVTALPGPRSGDHPAASIQNSYQAISRILIPRLVGFVVGTPEKPSKLKGASKADVEKGYNADIVDVLIDVVRQFGSMLTEKELQALQTTALDIINDDKAGAVVKKKAVSAIPVLMPNLSDHLLSALVSSLIMSFNSAHLTPFRRRYLIATIGSLARANPTKFGPYLRSLAPFVLSALNLEDLEDEEDEDVQFTEVLEVALVALEGLLGYCSNDMQPYIQETVTGALQCLKYDPNIVDADDQEMGGTQEDSDEDNADGFEDEDDDFEADGGYSDIDDMSWKVRRGAAKVLLTAASPGVSRELFEDGTLYRKVAPALISRFTKEREESVKLEVISAMSQLVISTGPGTGAQSSDSLDGTVSPLMASRKRRRQLSDASMYEFQPPPGAVSSMEAISPDISFTPTGSEAQLARLIPDIVSAISKPQKGTSIPTKQAAMALLYNITTVLHGGLADHMQKLQAPIADALKGAGFSGSAGLSSAAGIDLQIKTLALIGAIAETHRSSQVLPYLKTLLPGVIHAVQDPNYKVSVAGLEAVEQIIKVFTPPRVKNVEQSDPSQLETIFEIVKDQVTATKADLQVRSCAIRALGSLLARTSDEVGMKLLAANQRTTALQILLDRLRNETTRVYAARALGEVVHYASHKKAFQTQWLRAVTLELGAQLRKSDRALRGSCLVALKNICNNPVSRGFLDAKTIKDTCSMLLPLLSADDDHLLGPALSILSKIISADAVTADLIKALCSVVVSPISGSVLNNLLLLMRTIGEQGAGAPLMDALLKEVGVSGDPSIVGKAIGSLLVFGGSSINVTLTDFVSELRTASDAKRKCLALSVIGEAALRMSTEFPLGPEIFITNFQSTFDEVKLSAAVALGAAASTDMKQYLPVILKQMDKSDSSKYLLLHSIKEILQHPSSVRKEVTPYSRQLWDYLVAASYAEDNRAVGAECLGRLALLDPQTFLPLLQDYLKNENQAVRGAVIQALRFTLADTSQNYSNVLKPLIAPMLTSMLADEELENHRLALTTLNSALHNKIELIIPSLSQLLPLVMRDTYIKPELVREVQMGPFKHKVDDGLEIRKSAYETLYALLDSPVLPRADLPSIYARIVDGVADEHDIRVLANLMVLKLITQAPDETKRNLDGLADKYRAVLSYKPKDNAVKQELEKLAEANKSVIRVSRELSKAFPAAAAGGVVDAGAGAEAAGWKNYWDWVRGEFRAVLRDLDDEG